MIKRHRKTEMGWWVKWSHKDEASAEFKGPVTKKTTVGMKSEGGVCTTSRICQFFPQDAYFRNPLSKSPTNCNFFLYFLCLFNDIKV